MRLLFPSPPLLAKSMGAGNVSCIAINLNYWLMNLIKPGHIYVNLVLSLVSIAASPLFGVATNTLLMHLLVQKHSCLAHRVQFSIIIHI